MEKAKCIKNSSADNILSGPQRTHIHWGLPMYQAPTNTYAVASQPLKDQNQANLSAISFQELEFLNYHLILKRSNDLVHTPQ